MTVAGGSAPVRYDLGALPPMASPYFNQLVLVNAPNDLGLPAVNISLPTGAVVTHAIALITFRSVYNTNVAINSIANGQDIVCYDPVTGNPIPVFSFGGGELSTDPASYGGGDVLVGYDFASSVTLSDGDSLAFTWLAAQSLFPNFNINDIQMILRLWVD